LEVAIDDSLWITELDSGDFEDSILNLTLNAKDAMKSGGTVNIVAGNVTVNEADLKQIDNSEIEKGDYVRVSVSDTGVGMSSEVLEKVFDPFFTTKALGEGTGLGLSMVYGFTQRSGAFINMKSVVGEGTKIEIYFPRFTGEFEKPAPEEITVVPINQGWDEVVLLVDDEIDLLETAKDFLSSLGYEVKTADSMVAAIQVLQSVDTIDLVISDILMPGEGNGIDLAREILKQHTNTSVLLTSGCSPDMLEDLGFNQLKLPLMAKPFTYEALATKIRKILDNKSARNARLRA